MSDVVVINPGSDLVINGVLTDDAGPVNITGAVLSTFEVPPALLPHVTLLVTNAAAGALTLTIKWSLDFPRDIIMPLRVTLTQAGIVTAWPAIKLRVQS